MKADPMKLSDKIIAVRSLKKLEKTLSSKMKEQYNMFIKEYLDLGI